MATILAINAALIVLLMLVAWRVAVRIQDVSFVDAIWPLGMVVLTGASLAQAPPPHAPRLILMALVTIWGVRLGAHLFVRWRHLGPDPRYQKLIATWRDGGSGRERSFAFVTVTRVFLLQGLLLWFVSLPAQVGVIAAQRDGLAPWQWVGVALALFGIAFEAIADWQLAQFRRNSDGRQVMRDGLWRYSRHPNYFGDACAWWGIWLAALSSWATAATIAAPIFLTWTLIRWSGAPLLEGSMARRKPEYAEYVRVTSVFIPRRPKA